MSKNTTIAILGGTGKEGKGLAYRWAYKGYPIIIGSRAAEKAEATAAEINQALGTNNVRGLDNDHAARLADISVLTVVQAVHQVVLEELKDSLQHKILIDATARVDFRDPHPPAPPSAGQIAQAILGPNVQVVAALQNVPAHALKQNLGQPLDFDVPVCADEEAAARQVMALIEGAGMSAYYAGKLENALVVEGLVSLLMSVNKYYKVKTASIKITGIK